jgi:hypothetical protein
MTLNLTECKVSPDGELNNFADPSNQDKFIRKALKSSYDSGWFLRCHKMLILQGYYRQPIKVTQTLPLPCSQYGLTI